MTVPACKNYSGARAVPDDHAEGGYGPCPSCVVDAGKSGGSPGAALSTLRGVGSSAAVAAAAVVR